ncbi:MAG TPA: TIGR03617 family F420-dependent LLM class oxidoreductase [Chloroflexota bacterium]|nr:TIGR03617 family F420-dependent LLM class oxidoreductase [Chloroflexota bacterium]
MKVDTHLPTDPRRAIGELARAAEAIGFDGLWTAETAHDPFLPLALAASATSRIELGTAVAIAFARSPTVVAQTAWDLQALSRGRFILGLGTQVKAHVERRFAMAWGPPAPRLREYVGLVRALWSTWQDGAPLDFRGEHYSATLMTPFFDPGPIGAAAPPIHIAGVAPPLLRLAGEVADGLAVHPLHTRSYLIEVARPAIARGAARAGRGGPAVALSVPAFVVTGRDRAERERVRAQVRARIAFYASTPSYAPVMEHHGWGEARAALSSLAARRRWEEMPGLIDDAMLCALAVDAEPADVAPALRERYAGLADRLSLSVPFVAGQDDHFWRETLAALR